MQKMTLGNKYASVIVGLLFCLTSNAQTQPDTSRSYGPPVNGKFYYPGSLKIGSQLQIPKDTFKLARTDSGAIAYKGGGFYAWNGGYWSTVGGGGGWLPTGNSGTTPGTQYIGTSDAKDLVIKTNAIERGRFDINGRFTVKNILNVNPITGAVDSLKAYGNSITYGDVVGTDSTYAHKYAFLRSLPYDNEAVSGTGVFRAIYQQYSSLSQTHNSLVTVMPLLNDIRRGGLSALTYKKCVWLTKSFLINYWLKSGYQSAGSGANVTRYGGGWNAPYNVSGFYGRTTTGAFTQTVNDSIVYSFTDSSVIVGMIASGGVSHTFSNDIEVYIDNVLQEHLNTNNIYDNQSDGTYANTYGPFTIYYSGLSYGAHKIKLVNKNANYCMVDFFGHLRTDLIQKPIILNEPYMNQTGYNTSPANASTSKITTYNNAIDSMVTTFPAWYRPIRIQTNNYYDTTTGTSGDGIHPNQVGQNQIYNGFIAQAGTITTNVYQSGDFVNSNSRLFFKDGSTLNKIAFTSDGDFIQNQTTSTQAAGFKINGASTIANSLTIGNSSLGGSITARIQTGSDQNFFLYGDSPGNYFENVDNARANGKALAIYANGIDWFSRTSGSNTATMSLSSAGYLTTTSSVRSNAALHVMGAVTTYPGAGIHLQYNSGAGYIDGYDGSTWKPLNIRASSITISQGDLVISGTTGSTIKWSATSGAPSNTTTRAGWVKINVAGSDAWIPYYQ